MIQEYLFLDTTQKDQVEKIKYDKVDYNIRDFGSEGHFIVTYYIKGETKDNAIELSKINEEIIKLEPIVLSNDSAAYFNKVLYPLFNIFERKLRKFVSLASVYYKVDEAKELLKKMESMNFEDIYTQLFIDKRFVKKATEFVNTKSRNNRLLKDELINFLDSVNEETIWDKLVGEYNLTSVSENFLDIKECRNDIMHAHNINYREFKLAKELVENANDELDIEISLFDLNDNSSQNLNSISGAVEAIKELADALKAVSFKPYNSDEYFKYLEQPILEMSKQIRELYLKQNLLPDEKEQLAEQTDEEDKDGQVENGD